MRDPVTGFLYPAKWVEKASDPAGLALVADGFAVLTASGAILRRGTRPGPRQQPRARQRSSPFLVT